jgi:hypothetical protein
MLVVMVGYAPSWTLREIRTGKSPKRSRAGLARRGMQQAQPSACRRAGREKQDDLRAMKGIVVGCLLSLPVWAAILTVATTLS